LLPEEGDINLLAEAIEMDGNVVILSDDKDLTMFAGPIKEKFRVGVYWK